MYNSMRRLHQDERGLSALETAIVLIAFVVVASVFAFTMLSAGMFSTERSKEAVYAGLSEVRGSMELRGSVVAQADSAETPTAIDKIEFTVSNVAGGEPIDLTPSTWTTATNKVVMAYRDETQMINALEWNVVWLVHDNDVMLEEGELAKVVVAGLATESNANELDTALTINKLFALEIKPPQGSILILERRTPAALDPVMDLK